MPRKPKNVTDEQMNTYEQYANIQQIYKEIVTDYTVPEEIAYLASSLMNQRIDPTDQGVLDLFAKKDPETGDFKSLGLKAAEKPDKESFLAFLRQMDQELKQFTRENPVYNFAYSSTNRSAGQMLYHGETRMQFATESNVQAGDRSREDFIAAHEEAMDRFARNTKTYTDVVMAIRDDRTQREVLEDSAKTAAQAELSINICAGRSNALLGRDEAYRQLSEIPLHRYEGIPMEGLALLAANSLKANLSVKDLSSGTLTRLETDQPLTEEEQQIIMETEKALQLENVGAKVIDSFFSGTDVSRMGGRATAIISGRLALNEAMEKYQVGDKKPLADLMADSFEAVHAQVFYTGKSTVTAYGSKAVSEICKACDTMFQKDPALQELAGISKKQMDELKGASAVFDQVVEPQKRLLEAYDLDKGPGTPERKEALENILFSTYLENTVGIEAPGQWKKAEKIAVDQMKDPKYGALADKFPEDLRVYVRDSVKKKFANANMEFLPVYNALGKEGKSISELKESILQDIRKTNEYKNFLSMDKDELFKSDLKEFTRSIVRKKYDANKQIEEDEAFFKENKDRIDKGSELTQIWTDISGDYELSAQKADLASEFAMLGLDITKQEQIDLFRYKDPETGKYTPIPVTAAAATDKESMLKFIDTFEAALGQCKNIYCFGFLGTKANSVTRLSKAESGAIDVRAQPLEDPIPKKPEEVADPGWFKSTVNRWFGWYKQDVEPYNNYLKKENARNAVVKNNREKMKVYSQNRETLDKNKKLAALCYRKKTNEQNNRTAEQILQDASQNEKQHDCCIDLVAGRSDKLLGRHKNYKELSTNKLKDIPGIPMGGLALLAANSVKLNKGVRDASTQIGGDQYHPTQPFDAADRALLQRISGATDRTNIAAKVMESLYCGADVARMGDRAASAVAGRKALNEAAEKYLAGDEQPLADLINDSIDVLYETANEIGANADTPQGKAVSEMYKALEKMFAQDPEFRKDIHISDEKLNVIRGAATVCDLVADPNRQMLEAFRKDEGPGTESRKEVLDDLLFKNYLSNVVTKEAERNKIQAAAKYEEKYTGGEYAKLSGKLQGREQTNVCASVLTYCFAEEMKPSKFLQRFSAKDLDLAKEKEIMLSEIRKSPKYAELLSMDKEKLYREDLKAFTGSILEGQIAERQSREAAAANERVAGENREPAVENIQPAAKHSKKQVEEPAIDEPVASI